MRRKQAHGVWSLELQGQYDFDETAGLRSFTPSAGIPDTSIHPGNGFEGGGKVAYQPVGRAGGFKLSRYSDVMGPRVFARTTSPFAGELGERGFSVGLSAGAGVLFGRQSAKNDVHLSSGTPGQFPQFSRSRRVTVPTVDAAAQVNWAVPGSPLVVSAGYRYDGSYQVLDGGSAGSSHQINSVQHGPFLAVVWNLD